MLLQIFFFGQGYHKGFDEVLLEDFAAVDFFTVLDLGSLLQKLFLVGFYVFFVLFDQLFDLVFVEILDSDQTVLLLFGPFNFFVQNFNLLNKHIVLFNNEFGVVLEHFVSLVLATFSSVKLKLYECLRQLTHSL